MTSAVLTMAGVTIFVKINTVQEHAPASLAMSWVMMKNHAMVSVTSDNVHVRAPYFAFHINPYVCVCIYNLCVFCPSVLCMLTNIEIDKLIHLFK